AVREVIDGFAAAPLPDPAAVRLLGQAAAGATGQAAQVLFLTLGAVVEGGASPEAAWPAVDKGLAAELAKATRFARACVRRAGTEDLEHAFAEAGAAAAAKSPDDAAAWRLLPARCLAAVACLTRSRTLRKRVRKDGTLPKATGP